MDIAVFVSMFVKGTLFNLNSAQSSKIVTWLENFLLAVNLVNSVEFQEWLVVSWVVPSVVVVSIIIIIIVVVVVYITSVVSSLGGRFLHRHSTGGRDLAE